MNKVVLITGASAGIGLACANLFAESGYTVYGTGRRQFSADKFNYVVADVNDYARMREVFEEIYSRYGRIDVVINNAGFGIAGAVEDASIDSITAITQTNFVSLAVMCKFAVPYLKQTKGRIINIGSVGGVIPLPYQASYSATKAAVETFSRAFAAEVKPFGIKVSCILPNDTKTEFTFSRVKEENESTGNCEKMRKSVAKMERDEQRGVPPEKVARVIAKVARSRRRILRKSVGLSSKAIVFLTRFFSVRSINDIVRSLYL